ncbi:MAG: hypothetical protein AB7O57_11005 [Hyphomicrobiaceae bacterium]
MTIALVREHAERMVPPRALWVSFPLGRPFGAPDDPGLQARVLAAALDLLVSATAHGALVDFPEDAPAMSLEEMEGLVCPVPLPRPARSHGTDHMTAVAAEVEQLASLAAGRKRSTYGISGLALEDVIAVLAALAAGRPAAAAPGLTLGQTLRFASEDLKTWYLEAVAGSTRAKVSPEPAADWFWGETAAGALLLAIAVAARNHADPDVRRVAERTLVPRTQAHRLASMGDATRGSADARRSNGGSP